VEFWKIRLSVRRPGVHAWQDGGGWEDAASCAYLLLTKVPGGVRVEIVPARGRPDRLRIGPGVTARSVAVEIGNPPPSQEDTARASLLGRE
jgi:hypothetical protein